ncbi:MAG: bifunctional riboflavin kinase/FAD synthetase [Akkermansiaceae bacterium]|jgi:riboflavin kinase / FMN adenylyltransferase|nr:bifunctional riboflavin kinase/FAD synthetase [Akkermansiaceae bacterium]MDP4646524.1 bifunctional riboflavin kinase/FAD synthetase [Akkermansiaceae bacterium]MDP4720479.1 bifunctional riboflavin kinase/FAD synthetase [Akkermansiaceae bacterium]MDP4779315.1 bifunctional riboflavin kinase/FAD synthetase [Akkermansiaceae bacterium]MDP4846479.1 bifunctional riboflavin kinase/FAD synthetase [Akkermansiaceae bacterium]
MPIRLDSLDELAAQEVQLHLALGVFDGVHVGHQVVISRAVEAARAEGGKSFVVTFSPHPIRVIAPGKAPGALLATLDEKAELVKSYGVDGLLVIRFDEDFAKMEAEDFVMKITEGDVKTIAVGEDWRFGAKRKGDVSMLRRIGEERGFRLEAVAPVMWDGERISSTRIRQAIRDGAFGAVEKMLGRKYEVAGKVIEGRKLGRQLGFPTANIDPGDLQMPKDGVWAVDVEGIGRGVANLGVRPTVGGERKLLEVHILDFDGDLYCKVLKISFLRFIREERKFESVDQLKVQIGHDAEDARTVEISH